MIIKYSLSQWNQLWRKSWCRLGNCPPLRLRIEHNPPVEYYIAEDKFNPPSFGIYKGTVYDAGSEYTIYENTVTMHLPFKARRPSISISPQDLCLCGTVTVANRSEALKKLGLILGTFSYHIPAVEGWGGEGEAAPNCQLGNGKMTWPMCGRKANLVEEWRLYYWKVIERVSSVGSIHRRKY